MHKQSKLNRLLSLFMFLIFSTMLFPTTAVRAASGPPGAIRLSHTQWDSETDGDYDITIDIDSGNTADTYKLYEKYGMNGSFTVVAEGKFVQSQYNRPTATIEIRNKTKTGVYSYYAEAINADGVTRSDIKTAIVGTEKGYILLDGLDEESIAFQATVPQGISNYKLTSRTNSNPSYSVISSNTTVAKASIVNGDTLQIQGISEGRAGILIYDNNSGKYRQIGFRVKKADGTLPGMPEYLSLGQVSEDTQNDLNFWRDISYGDTNKRVDIRYIYLNDGPIDGWHTWDQGDGQRAKRYITESLKGGMIPFFVFYNIPDKIESYEQDLKHINDKAYMEAYFKNLKFFLDICNEYAKDETVGIILEPDFLGYMLQQSKKQPHEISAIAEAAYSSGVLEKGNDPEFQNNLTGLVEAINYTISKYRKDAYFGWQFNTWAYDSPEIPNQGLMHKTEFIGWDAGRQFIKNVAAETANYYKAAGVTSYGANFISIDKYGLDGAHEPGAAANPKGSKWFWNADLWNNYLLYTKTLHEVTEKPVLLWQIPVGHINNSEEPNPYNNGGKFPNLTNTATNYEDSAPSYFFGDTFDAASSERANYFGDNIANDPKIKKNGNKITWENHMEEARDAGIVSILYGAGVGGSTDAVGDGKTQLTDNYWWITKAQRYYKNPVPLDGKPAPNEKLPLKATLSSDTTNNKGTYTLTIDIPANSKATTYNLTENGTSIKTGAVSSSATKITHQITYKQTGTYLYNVELINSFGGTSSNNVTVYVTNNEVPNVDIPLKGSITVDNANNNGNYTLTLNIPKDSKATSYNLYENNKIVKTETVTSAAASIKVPFTNKPAGTYTYRLDLVNKDGTTPSDNLVVTSTSTAPSTGVAIDFAVSSDWGTGANFVLTITNNTNVDLENWTLEFNFDRSINYISDVDMKTVGNKFTLTPKPWNNVIKKGEKLTLSGGCAGTVNNLKPYNIKFSPLPDIPVDIPGDINGDGKVDALDLSAVSSRYNSKAGEASYLASCDMNKDGIIDLYDLVAISKLIK